MINISPDQSKNLHIFPTWEDISGEFEWDGSWRDIYIKGTGKTDWNRLLEFIGESMYESTLTEGPFSLSDHPDIVDIFDNNENNSRVSFRIGLQETMALNCHFFVFEEIEFDLDPRDFSDVRGFEKLKLFMADVGNLLDKDVALCPENMASNPFLVYLAGTRKFELNV